MREADLHKQVSKWLRSHKAIVIKLTMLGRYGVAGLPDLLVLWEGGKVDFIELKLPGKKPTPLQAAWHRKLGKYGFDVFVCHSLDEAKSNFDV